MAEDNLLTKREEEILTILGYIVMRWNYAEHIARQMLRKQIPGGSMNDPDHLKLSKRQAFWIEEQLKETLLPKWLGAPGLPYLNCLIPAFSRAREHRNHLVHGIQLTADTHGPYPAQAVLIPAKPIDDKSQLPSFATANDMKPISDHISDLGAFACEVNNAFDANGLRAKNKDGSDVVSVLPAMITAIPPCKYVTF